jgi:hypothetical protein
LGHRGKWNLARSRPEFFDILRRNNSVYFGHLRANSWTEAESLGFLLLQRRRQGKAGNYRNKSASRLAESHCPLRARLYSTRLAG